VYSLTIEIPIVGMPAFSITRCIRPTVWLQIPQPGVSNTISTPSDFSLSAASGAVTPVRVLM
jgi:hypothetical protein